MRLFVQSIPALSVPPSLTPPTYWNSIPLCKGASCGSGPVLGPPWTPALDTPSGSHALPHIGMTKEDYPNKPASLRGDPAVSLSFAVFCAVMDYCCWILVHLEDGGRAGPMGYTGNPSIAAFSQYEVYVAKHQNKPNKSWLSCNSSLIAPIPACVKVWLRGRGRCFVWIDLYTVKGFWLANEECFQTQQKIA